MRRTQGDHGFRVKRRLRFPGPPSFVRLFLNPIVRRLVATRLPMGPNVLISVPGRKTGVLHSTPVALIETSGRRWVIGAFGETEWVRNLRAAGRATITGGRESDQVTAVELPPAEAVDFFRDVLRPYVRRTRFGLLMVRTISRLFLGAFDAIDRPAEAAQGRPVFELHREGESRGR